MVPVQQKVTPVIDAQKAACSKPIRAKRPLPVASGVMNFCAPSERKINPTTNRGISVGVEVVAVILLIMER